MSGTVRLAELLREKDERIAALEAEIEKHKGNARDLVAEVEAAEQRAEEAERQTKKLTTAMASLIQSIRRNAPQALALTILADSTASLAKEKPDE